MTYDSEKILMGKQAVQIVELYCDRCTRTYGTAPCTAAVGVTGTKKCYNTFETCQDRTNFDKTTVLFRYATEKVDGIQAAGDPPVFPTLVSVGTAPTVLQPGKGLGIRSTVTAKISDHPWTDAFDDPYQSTRTFTADNQGSYWGKWLKRNRYYQWRKMVVRSGFLDSSGVYVAANFRTREYVIQSITGPDASGTVSITGQDPLKLADNDKSQWPVPSDAVVTTFDLTVSSTTVYVSDPSGTLYDSLNGGQVYVRIGDEIMYVSAFSASGTKVTSLTVTRASMPSFYEGSFNQALTHKIGDTIHTVRLYNGSMIYDVVYDLLNVACGINASYLDYTNWVTNIDTYFPWMKVYRLLVEPTGVRDLLIELTQIGLMIWWDERAAKIKLSGLQFYGPLTAQINDDDHIEADSFSSTEDQASLITEHWTYFAHQWPLANKDLLRSYRIVNVGVDLDAEGANAYGRPQIFRLPTRWLGPAQQDVALSVGTVQLIQNASVRKIITWTMDAKDDSYWVGDIVGLSSRYVQDDDGASTARNYLITQAEEIWTGVGLKFKYTAIEQFNFTRTGNISYRDGSGGGSDPADYGSATDSEKSLWAYISNDSGFFSDGTSAYKIQFP